MDNTTTRHRTWLAAGGGTILGAGAAVAALLAIGWSAEGGTGGGQDATLTLPDTADGLRSEEAVVMELRGEAVPGREEALAETAELLGDSRGGLAADVQAYAAEDLDLRVTVWAVAQESSPLWSSQESEAMAELMNLASPMEWVERDGDVEEGQVECLMRTLNPAPRDRGDEVEAVVTECQLVTDGVTLVLQGAQLESIDRPAAILRDVAANLERG